MFLEYMSGNALLEFLLTLKPTKVQKSVYNIVKLAVCGNVYLFLTNQYDKKLECDSCLDEFDEYDD